MRSNGLTGVVLLLCAACGASTAAPPPQPQASSAPTDSPEQAVERIQVCVLEGGQLRVVEATVDRSRGDTLVGGRSFRESDAARSGYAAAASWYINNEPITWEGRRYTKYGPLRILAPTQLRAGGQHEGIGFFIEANATGTPEVIFVPTGPGCEFHAYQWDLTTGGVRGGG